MRTDYDKTKAQGAVAQAIVNQFFYQSLQAEEARRMCVAMAMMQQVQNPRDMSQWRLFAAAEIMTPKSGGSFVSGDVGVGYLNGHELTAWSLRSGYCVGGYTDTDVKWLETPVVVGLYNTECQASLQRLATFMPNYTYEEIVQQALEHLLDGARRAAEMHVSSHTTDRGAK